MDFTVNKVGDSFKVRYDGKAIRGAGYHNRDFAQIVAGLLTRYFDGVEGAEAQEVIIAKGHCEAGAHAAISLITPYC